MRKAIRFIVVAIPLLFLAVLIDSVLHVFHSARVASVRSSCFSNVKDLSMAALQYAGEFDEKLPTTASWMGKLSKYSKHDFDKTSIYCPELKAEDCGYAMFSKVSGKKIDKIEAPDTTLLYFETWKLGRNVSGQEDLLLKEPRHSTIEVGFADGHVKSVNAGR